MTHTESPQPGLHDKFRVERTDGKSAHGAKHDGCRYYVLDVDHDPHALPALRTYAESVRGDNPVLARDLDVLVNEDAWLWSADGGAWMRDTVPAEPVPGASQCDASTLTVTWQQHAEHAHPTDRCQWCRMRVGPFPPIVTAEQLKDAGEVIWDVYGDDDPSGLGMAVSVAQDVLAALGIKVTE